MVEYAADLNLIFRAMADETRRDILRRVLSGEQTISELVGNYTMSFASVAKHIQVLTNAGLLYKTKRGREQVLTAQPDAIKQIEQLMLEYERVWQSRFDALDTLLKEES